MAQTSTAAPKSLEEVKNEWDKESSSWDKGFMGIVVARFNRIAAACIRDVAKDKLGESCRLLDFGCGTGQLCLQLLPECHSVLAMDVAPGMIQQLDAKLAKDGTPNVTTWCGDIVDGAACPAQDDSFDLVVSGSVITFAPDLPATLKRLTQVTKPGGLAVHFAFGSDPKSDQAPRPQGRADMLGYEDGMSEAQLRSEMKDAGMDVKAVGQINVPLIHWLIPFIGMKWRYVVAVKPE